jgi:hypothetical protein
MDAEGVRGICGRSDFKGDTFRTRKALQVSVGQHDCGRFPAQKGTFRKTAKVETTMREFPQSSMIFYASGVKDGAHWRRIELIVAFSLCC